MRGNTDRFGVPASDKSDLTGFAVGALRQLSNVQLLDRWGVRESVEKLVARATSTGFSTAMTAQRTVRSFTRGGTNYIPGKGGSIGTPKAMMKWLVSLERGDIVDPATSLEIKRLLYLTDTRVRYANNKSLKDAAVYFKSGSLYKCNGKADDPCGKFKGNVENYMNSVAIVERGDSVVYLVALMTNVLRKNSNIDHNLLAGKVDKLVRE